jgi:glycosyltransferase involved in cell wall biosynthesis
MRYLDRKINALIRELKTFNTFELIIIDNRSCDGSKEMLEYYGDRENIRVLHNEKCKSVASTINIGVSEARYDCIIFSDLRQDLSPFALQKIVAPMRNKSIGAVSACLSAIDKNGHVSITRRIENKIKKMECKTGNLIGVYGPLYAIRKSCFQPVPGHIILEDLYLSLSILRSHKISLRQDCLIFDNDFTEVYNFKRAIRYSRGLFQLVLEPRLLSGLSALQLIMLFWHKYLRLLLPVLGFALLIALCIQFHCLVVLLSTATLLSAIFFIPAYTSLQEKIKEMTRINLYYLGAFFNSLIYPIGKAYRYTILAATHFFETL